jgi:hypothetical protein
MSQTERVRYALKNYEFREVSKGKGVVEYHLVDEYGNPRKVTAMAVLNWRKQISSVRPIHHRELPLVEALAEASLNETIEVDFAEFNKKYPRGSMRAKKISVSNFKISKHDKQAITSMSSLIDHKARLMQLVALSAASFAAIMFLFHST